MGLKNISGRYRHETIFFVSESEEDPVEIDCAVIVPSTYDRDMQNSELLHVTYPTILALSGGPQQLFNWEDWAHHYFEKSEIQGLGSNWMIISPLAPADGSFNYFSDPGTGYLAGILQKMQSTLNFKAEARKNVKNLQLDSDRSH